MKEFLESMGIMGVTAAYRNLTPAELTERALARGEGKLSNTGALVIKTGKYTGRSPNDRFIVDSPDVHDKVDWGKINMPIERAKADAMFLSSLSRQHRSTPTMGSCHGAMPYI